MRHWAWLVAQPRPERRGRRSALVERPSRLEKMQQEGQTPDLPPVDAGSHLLGYLWEVGPNMPSGMGAMPLTFTELQAWQASTGTPLQAWEMRTLRTLSAEYTAELRRAEDPAAPSPWTPEPTEATRASVSQRLAAALRARAQERPSHEGRQRP